MDENSYPVFLRDFPEAQLGLDGVKGWLVRGENGLAVLFESEVEAEIPPHSHGNQWGIVVSGRLDLRIGDQVKTYTAGGSYFIPAGVEHQATIYPGFRAVDIFEDADRYKTKSG